MNYYTDTQLKPSFPWSVRGLSTTNQSFSYEHSIVKAQERINNMPTRRPPACQESNQATRKAQFNNLISVYEAEIDRLEECVCRVTQDLHYLNQVGFFI